MPGTSARPQKPDKPVQATLGPKDDGEDPVLFQFNPEQIKIDHTAPSDKKGGNQSSQEEGKKDNSANYLTPEAQLLASGATTVSFDNIVFDGPGVQEVCIRLLNWSYPIDSATGKIDPDKHKVPELQFRWGTLTFKGSLNRVGVTYKRFSSTGIPTRANVSFSLTQINLPHRNTNPTSGGLPGRRTHVVASGDCLPAIATASYSGPGDWRPLAEANRIDDPLRVRPGTLLYLPGAGELARPAQGRS